MAELTRVLLIANLTKPVEQVRDWLQKNESPVNLVLRGETEVFASALLDYNVVKLDSPGITTHLKRVNQALLRERQGQTKGAIKILEALASEPLGENRDYLLWGALARNLRAAGMKDRLRKHCKTWMRPFRIEAAYFVLRGSCDAAK